MVFGKNGPRSHHDVRRDEKPVNYGIKDPWGDYREDAERELHCMSIVGTLCSKSAVWPFRPVRLVPGAEGTQSIVVVTLPVYFESGDSETSRSHHLVRTLPEPCVSMCSNW
jgi:hypothetical protein